MKKVLAVIFAAAMLCIPVRSQTPPPAAGPHLNEVEKLKIENIQLKFTQLSQEMQAAQQKQQELRTQYMELVAGIEKEHPGYTVGGNGDLVAKPKEAPKPEVKK